MEDLDKQNSEKSKLTKVNSFPVPLVRGNEKINLTNNNSSEKEKIINKAFKLQSQGKFQEAAGYYQLLIGQGIDNHIILSNYGQILKGLRQLNEAELYTRKAIEIKPNYINAHYNLGNILKDLGRQDDAEKSYRKAIELNPNFPEAYLNLGILLNNLGKIKEAIVFIHQAIKIKPNFAEAYLNLGIILKDHGEYEKAFDYHLKAMEIYEDNPINYFLITHLLKECNPSKLDKNQLKIILNILLKRDDIPHNELFIVFNYLYRNEFIHYKDKSSKILNNKQYKKLISDELLIKAMKKIILRDSKWEHLLTNFRNYISKIIFKKVRIINSNELKFILALAEQCFLNEYIYPVTEEEHESIQKIIKRCSLGKINKTNISIISCYLPLYKIIDQIKLVYTINSQDENFDELIKLQIIEPLEEKKLSKNIKSVSSIVDNISKKVKSQYEENPYPRWKFGDPSKESKISYNQLINTDIKPNYISPNIDSRQLEILIAGCGTGNQILHAQRYKNSKITAIDLSSSSLAYAQRQINAIGISNTELIQMDILELKLLGKQFDIIECVGVLHHMKDPSEGLKCLLRVLKNNGFINLGLYSQIARKNIKQARDYIMHSKLKATNDDIRIFRENVFSGKVEQLNNLRHWRDFYTTSECRDLCFHVQEHTFTINQLEDTFSTHNLNFLGFILPQNIKSVYKNYFPKDVKAIKLKNWGEFETMHPNTFRGMYQFWLNKITD